MGVGQVGKRNRKTNRQGRQRPKGSPNWLYFLIAVAVTVAIGLGTVMAVGGDGSPSPAPTGSEVSYPRWLALAPSAVKAAYAYAEANPQTISYIPCYCGCGVHSGHRSTYDCFIANVAADGAVTYDDHGANCDMCVDAALMTKDMLSQGKSLKEARQAVDRKYSSLGPGTDTPPLP